MTGKPTYEELETKIRQLEQEKSEDKQTEESLLKSEKKFHSLFESINDSLFVHLLTEDNLPGHFIEVNDMACKKLGYSKQELLQLTPRDISAPDDGMNPVEIRNKLLAHGNTLFETTHLTKEGHLIPVESHIRLFDYDGQQAVLSIARDITERKQAEEVLRVSEIKYQEIFENIQIPYHEVTLDGILLEISPSIEKVSQYTRKELIGQSLLELYDDPKERELLINKLLIEKEIKDYEICLLDKDGTRKKVSLTVKLITDSERNPIKIIGSMQDITKRKQAEKTLQETEERFRTLFDNAPIAIQGYNPYGIIHYWNNECEKVYGYTKDEAIGKNLIDLIIPPEMRTFVSEAIKQGSKTGELPPQENLLLMRKDGSRVPVFSSHTLLKPKENETEFYCLDVDMTIQNELQSQLRQAQKMEAIGTLAGGIAHDFNNILFPVLGHTEILLEELPDGSSTHDRLKQIYKGGIRARDLVKQILTFSRQNEVELKIIKLQPIIKEAMKFIRATIPTSIEIIEDISIRCGNVKADSTQIHQIVINLTTNAYHAMDETGGKLKVSLKEIEYSEIDIAMPDMRSGIYACLTVEDTGIGMENELTVKIFDPFYTTKEKGKGTGMGLAVVHGIVTSMNGIIQVHSSPDEGTKFNVYLPVERRKSEKKRTQFIESIQGGNETILVVDDEEDIVEMEKQILERFGYQVVQHTSSVETLKTFCKTPEKFDMVIMDMSMPTMSGDKLAVELLKIRPDIPILLCTGFSETVTEEKAALLGIKGFLIKPITMNMFAQKIRHVLDEAEG